MQSTRSLCGFGICSRLCCLAFLHLLLQGTQRALQGRELLRETAKRAAPGSPPRPPRPPCGPAPRRISWPVLFALPPASSPRQPTHFARPRSPQVTTAPEPLPLLPSSPHSSSLLLVACSACPSCIFFSEALREDRKVASSSRQSNIGLGLTTCISARPPTLLRDFGRLCRLTLLRLLSQRIQRRLQGRDVLPWFSCRHNAASIQ